MLTFTGELPWACERGTGLKLPRDDTGTRRRDQAHPERTL